MSREQYLHLYPCTLPTAPVSRSFGLRSSLVAWWKTSNSLPPIKLQGHVRQVSSSRIVSRSMLRNLNLLQTRVCHRGFSSEGFISRAKAHGANALLGAFVHQGKFDQCMKDLTVVSIGDGVVKCTMPVTKEVSNVFNTLHGGATSTLIDVVGTMAVLSKDPVRPGVSVELNTSFVSAAKVGSEITCEGRLLKLGRKLAYTQVDVYGEDGKLVATGRHTKAFA